MDKAEEFAQLALSLEDTDAVDATAEQVLDFALHAVGCQWAGVTFTHRRARTETVATTHPLVEELDTLQLDLRQGPNVDLLTDGRLAILVTDTETETRWPLWSKAAAQLGVRSMVCALLYTSSATVGALNLYSDRPDNFDLDDEAVAHILARHAAIALSRARHTGNLHKAIDARKRIGQAQGILMERFHLNEEQAFGVLLRYSQDNNVKLREIARELVTTRELPNRSADEPGPTDG